MANEEESCVDGFSSLPEPIAHEIMSLLSPADIGRIPLLSKTWRHTWSTFPIMDLDINFFPKQKTDNLWSILKCQIEQKVTLHKLKVCAPRTCYNLPPLVDSAFHAALKKGVQELYLSVVEKHLNDNLLLPLPNSIYSASAITNLELHKSELTLSCLIRGCSSLKILKLVDCCYKEAIEGKVHMVRGGKLQKVEMVRCLEDKLTNIHLASAPDKEFIIIKAPNLQSLVCDKVTHNIRFTPGNQLRLVKLSNGKLVSNPDIYTAKLRRLELANCLVGDNVAMSIVNCKSMKILSLHGTTFSKEGFENCVSGLVSLEVLKLRPLKSLKDLKFSNNNVKKIEIITFVSWLSITIKAPNLVSFLYENKNHACEPWHFDPSPCKLDLSACKLVKIIKLRDAPISDNWITENLSIFHQLETLKLTNCRMLRSVEVLHEQLNNLQLGSCANVTNVKVDTSRLRSFVYRGAITSFDLVNDHALSDAKLNLEPNVLDSYWFVRLRNFLASFNHTETITLISTLDKNLIYPEELRLRISPLHDLRHMKIEVKELTTSWVDLMDSFLWLCPHPKSLVFVVSSVEKMFKFYYHSRLVDTGEEETKCCMYNPFKCWRHGLRMLEIQNLRGGNDVDLKNGGGNDIKNYFYKNAKQLKKIC